MQVHFGRKLTNRHFISRFKIDDAATKLRAFKALDEFSFGFTRTDDQQCLDITNTCDYVIIKCGQMIHFLVLKPVLRNKVILGVFVF